MRLQANGNGKQGVYLTELTAAFAQALAGLIGTEAQSLIAAVSRGTPMQTNDDLDVWEHRIESEIQKDESQTDTSRDATIQARRDRALFKERIMQIEKLLIGVDQLFDPGFSGFDPCDTATLSRGVAFATRARRSLRRC
jgi:hypothetical protein